MGNLGDTDRSQKDRPKADLSKFQSGSSTAAPAQTTPKFKTYVVQTGDSLSKIAKKEYGNANDWPKILEASRDLIHPGQTLKIPTA